MKIIDTNSYKVLIGNDFSEELINIIKKGNFSKIFLLCDENTEKYCLPIIKNLINIEQVITIPSGELFKNLDTCSDVWEVLTDENADRKSLLINLGGGVITDMGGFIASLYKRGITFLNLPTTLLSQVDASVGGKLGIDFKGFKNQIGLFNNALSVFIIPDFLKTLDNRQLLSGYAEVIKHGLIYDNDYWGVINSKKLSDHDLTYLITRSVEIKNEVVNQDPLEKGLRKILNFGHTIGHAVESYSLANDSNPLLHGEAISIGMICESFLSYKVNYLTKEELNNIVNYINNIFDKYILKDDIFEELFELMKNDKKNNTNKISFSLINKIGSCNYDIYTEKDIIFEALKFYQNI